MKRLMLRVIFDCRERIYSDCEVVGHGHLFEVTKVLKNWQEVLDFISEQSLHDTDCEVFDIRPMEINLCEEETVEESEQAAEEETAAASCSAVADDTLPAK